MHQRTEVIASEDKGSPAQNVQAPTPTTSETRIASTAREVHHTPTPTPTPAVRTLEQRSPTPTTALIAQLQEIDATAVEAVIVGVREAWQRGDQSVVADALIAQASLLETLGARLLRVAGAKDNPKSVEVYTGLALRALEQARKTLATLASLRGEKARVQTNVQVNVGQPTSELLGGAHGERLVG